MDEVFTSNKFKYDSNYKPEANFTRIKFGHDIPVLETELNEMQILQETNRVSLTRRLVPSGFIELIQKQFTGDAIIYNPVVSGVAKLNHIAIAPSRVMLNGYELNLIGNFTYNGYTDYILLDLEDAPTSGVREDLVYLEVWFENLDSTDTIKNWGYQSGNIINSNILDPRINTETSRRIGICWDIRIKKGINFNNFPDGFGFNSVTSYSSIQGIANGTLGFSSNMNLIFANANHTIFSGCEFYRDNNLWVSGRPGYTLPGNGIYGQYVYALPLFRIKRRNSSPYSLDNFNGGSSFNRNDVKFNSSVYGDLSNNPNNNNPRPDKLFYDYIVPQDLVDLRRTISVKEFNNEYYFNKTLKQLFTGNLQTKDTNQIRRVQFGIPEQDFTTNQNVVFLAKFNDDVNSTIPDSDFSKPNVTTANGDTIKFVECLNGNGLLFNGNNTISYGLSEFNTENGTIDFFMEPYWNGPDNVSQHILSIFDDNNNLVFTLDKVKKLLKFSQYNIDLNNNVTENDIYVDLTNHLLLAKNIYHIRLSWSNLGYINSNFVYINGKLCGQGSFMFTKLLPSKLQLGKIEDIGDNNGFIIENLTIFKKSYEENVVTGTYSYINNPYWPGLPQDFIYSNTVLLPSFNSEISHFGDNGYLQKNTIVKLDSQVDENYNLTKFILNDPDNIISSNPIPIVTDSKGIELTGTWNNLNTNTAIFVINQTISLIEVQYTAIANDSTQQIKSTTILSEPPETPPKNFILNVNINKIINNDPLPTVYDLDGNSISGVWTGLGTSTATFKTTMQIDEVLVIYDLLISPGDGGDDLPNELLAAGLIQSNNTIKEVSFSRKDISELRTVNFVNPRQVTNYVDTAYDLSSDRNDKSSVNKPYNLCFARLLYYYMNGNGTNQYTIPMNLYGYEVIAITSVKNRKMVKCTRTESTDTTPGYYTVNLSTSVLIGDIIEFEIALGGLTFDYETQTKTLVTNVCTTKMLTFTTDGINTSYSLPCFDNGYNSGILKAVITFTDNNFDSKNNFVDKTQYRFCYANNEMFYPQTTVNLDGTTTTKYVLSSFTLDESCLGTPFLKITLNTLLPKDTVIQIPIFITYQLKENDILSIWYNHIPYQGILSEDKIKVKRISDWKYFITTLSSGNLTLNIDEKNIHSLNNIVNRLPGGCANAHYLTGESIKFNHLISSLNKSDINTQLLFPKDVFFASNNNNFDQSFFELDTDLIISKPAEGFQDGLLTIDNTTFKVYFPDCANELIKYTGMCCLVLDQNGQILLFVIGNVDDNNSSATNTLIPIYGDLFKVPGLPTTIQQY